MNLRPVQTLSAALILLAGTQVGGQQTASGQVSFPETASKTATELSPQSEAGGQDTSSSKTSSQGQTPTPNPSNEGTTKTDIESKTLQNQTGDQDTKALPKVRLEKPDQSNETKPKTKGQPTQQTGSAGGRANTNRARKVIAGRKYGQFTSRDYQDVPARYEIELQHAKALGDSKTEAALALRQARALDFLSATDQKLSGRAVAAYRQAVTASAAAGDPAQSSLAANNLMVLLLKTGKVTEARQAATAIDLTSVPQAQRSILRFNIGRVQELDGDTWGAYTQYSEAFSSNPAMVSALQGAFRTLGKEQKRPLSEVATLSDRATANGLPDIANEQLLNLLDSWDGQELKGDTAGAQRLMAALLATYAAQELTPQVFRAREVPRLQKIAQTQGSLVEAIKEIEIAYLNKLPIYPREAAQAFAAWNSNQPARQSMAAALEHVADFYANHQQPEMALGRFGAGWELAHEPRCAVKYSSLLSRNPSLDPDDRLVDELVKEIFMEKGEAYMVGDWAHILPLHIALGTIFEVRHKWGENGDPRGALFQWRHAIAADTELRKKNPSMPVSPGLHVHFGNVLRAIGRNEDAVREFLTAGEGFVVAGDLTEARNAVRTIRELSPGGLPGSFSPDDFSRWEALARATGAS